MKNKQLLSALEDFRQNISDTVYRYAIRAGSLSKLSKSSGISRQSLSYWRRGVVAPTLDNLIKFLKWSEVICPEALDQLDRGSAKNKLKRKNKN